MAQHIGDLTKAVLTKAIVHIATNYELRNGLCVQLQSRSLVYPKLADLKIKTQN
jgi:hypothetical protein